MKLKHISIAALLALTGLAANATVTATYLGSSYIAPAGSTSYAPTSFVGGTVETGSAYFQYTSPFSDTTTPYIAVCPGTAAGAPGCSGPVSARLTFAAPVYSVVFDWGTPNYFDTVSFGGSTSTFTGNATGINGALPISGLPLNPLDGGYVMFTSTTALTSITLTATGTAFEAGKFVTAVPEPSNIALMLAGVGLMGFVARKRRI